MFNYFFSLFSDDIGIDLGTSTTLVYVKGQGIVLSEPSFVAYDRKLQEVNAIGEEAKKMVGKTPTWLEVIRPLKKGILVNFDITEKMICYFIKKVHNRSMFLHPRIVLGIPSGITEVERRAIKGAAEQAGAREVYLIEEPIAAAIGAGLQIQESIANMIVDIGGGVTETAVISLGGMVVMNSVPVAGDKFDETITSYIKRKYNLAIGLTTAENVKIKIGSVFPLQKEETMDIKGLDLTQGLPRTINVSSEEIRSALMEPAKSIIEGIKDVLEETPPELVVDLIDSGIVLVGEGSLIRGMVDLISKETHLPVHLVQDATNCVVLGIGKYLEEIDNIKKTQKLLQ